MRCLFWMALALPVFAQDPGRGVNFYSYEKEQALGRQIAAEYQRSATLIDNPELLARIEGIARDLIPANSKYTYTFALVVDEGIVRNEPIALPGGFIFVPSGLILNSPDTAEVARMLAHSIAHIEARHGTKQATKQQIVNQATIPLIFMGGWTGYGARKDGTVAVPLGFQKMREQMEVQADELGAQYVASSARPLPPIEELRTLLRASLPPAAPEKPKVPPRLAR